MLYNHDDPNYNSTYTNINAGRLCRFRYERIYEFLTSVHGDTRGETQFLKVYTNHTMLTPPQRAAHLVIFKISVGRDPKNPTTPFNGQNPPPYF